MVLKFYRHLFLAADESLWMFCSELPEILSSVSRITLRKPLSSCKEKLHLFCVTFIKINDFPNQIVIQSHVPGFFTPRKRSLRQGNVFTSVCQSFCSQGGLCMMSLPGPMFILGGGFLFLIPYPSVRGVSVQGPLCRETSPELEMRAVRILLECFLVGVKCWFV